MRSLLTLAAILLVTCSFATSKIVINGDLGSKLNGTATLSITGENLESKIISSAKISEGVFTLITEQVKYPTMAILNLQGGVHNIILENNSVNLTYSRETGYSISGGFYNELLFGWEKSNEVRELEQAISKLSNDFFSKELSEDEKTNYKSQMRAKSEQVFQIRKRHFSNLLEHQDSYVRLFAIMELHSYSQDVIDILNEIKSKIPLNYDILLIEAKKRERNERTQNKEELIIGAKYKDFTAVTPDQQSIALGDILEQKQYVLLEFWASWCRPCREQMKFLPAIYNKYKEAGFEIYSFSVDSKYDNWIKASQEMDIPWINTSNDSDGVDKVNKLYSISSIPNNYLLDKNGVIIAININSTQLSTFLELETK